MGGKFEFISNQFLNLMRIVSTQDLSDVVQIFPAKKNKACSRRANNLGLTGLHDLGVIMGSMRKSQLSKTKQYRLIEHFAAGAIARCADDPVRVNPKTAIYYFS